MIPPRRVETEVARIEIAVEHHFPIPGRLADDFEDDGGTPGWRERNTPPTTPPRRRNWLLILAAVALANWLLFLPVVIVFFGLLALFDR